MSYTNGDHNVTNATGLE